LYCISIFSAGLIAIFLNPEKNYLWYCGLLFESMHQFSELQFVIYRRTHYFVDGG